MYNYLLTLFDEGPGKWLLLLMVISIVFCFVVSIITRNYSQIDKLWPLLPSIYCLITLLYSSNPRIILMAILVWTWGLRLIYNFYRKGGYGWSSEDYRWSELKQIITNRLVFELFNLVFITIFQNILLLLIASPIYYAWKHERTKRLGSMDVVATLFFIIFLTIEIIADQQQWTFQVEKHAQSIKDRQHADGFLRKGLFRHSRHPNYFGEICLWWSFYLFSISKTSTILNWTIWGPILLTILFQASTAFTEKISIRKYPRYKLYKRTTSRLIPWFPSTD